MRRRWQARRVAIVVGALALGIAPSPGCSPAGQGESEGPAPAESAGPPQAREALIGEFVRLWSSEQNFYRASRWMGIPTLQNPMDAWVIQELIFETKPDVVLEAGTHHGGSALLWATVLEQVNPDGRVITIDIANKAAAARGLPIAKRRIEFLVGSSTAPEIVQEVTYRVGDGRVLVILDSLHTYEHVIQELELYSPLVQPGGYIVVQDTGVWRPAEGVEGGWASDAVAEFLEAHPGWEADASRERFWLTNCPGSFLRRVR